MFGAKPSIDAKRVEFVKLTCSCTSLSCSHVQALTTHGANPGLVSHYVKRALLNIAKDTGVDVAKPVRRSEWGALAKRLGVKVIHIAERDTQVCAHTPKKVGEFVNTWSVDGFIGEGCQPAELGWGTRKFPCNLVLRCMLIDQSAIY